MVRLQKAPTKVVRFWRHLVRFATSYHKQSRARSRGHARAHSKNRGVPSGPAIPASPVARSRRTSRRQFRVRAPLDYALVQYSPGVRGHTLLRRLFPLFSSASDFEVGFSRDAEKKVYTGDASGPPAVCGVACGQEIRALLC